MSTWNRELDQVEAKALHDLHAAGYRTVDKKHIIHFKAIYDFLSRFADPMYSGNVNLSMSSGSIPYKSKQIINKIGAENMFQYFSPQAYPTKFFRFCEKLIRTKSISSKDYLAVGSILATEYEVEESTYHDKV